MIRTLRSVLVCAGTAAIMAGCTAETPLTPVPSPGDSSTAPDGATLKVTAPTQVSPANNATISGQISLVISPSTGELGGRTLSYEYEIQTEAGVFVRSVTVGGTTCLMSGLSPNTVYKWRARAVLEGAFGP